MQRKQTPSETQRRTYRRKTDDIKTKASATRTYNRHISIIGQTDSIPDIKIKLDKQNLKQDWNLDYQKMATTDPPNNEMTEGEDANTPADTTTDGIPLDTTEANGENGVAHTINHADVPTDVDTSAMIAEAGK